MTLANWISIVLALSAAVGVILRGQHSLITKLLSEKWEAQDQRLTKVEDKTGTHTEEIYSLKNRVSLVESACSIRHPHKAL
jgi:peptidoglycan hydrolase CwlO-like protein